MADVASIIPGDASIGLSRGRNSVSMHSARVEVSADAEWETRDFEENPEISYDHPGGSYTWSTYEYSDITIEWSDGENTYTQGKDENGNATSVTITAELGYMFCITDEIALAFINGNSNLNLNDIEDAATVYASFTAKGTETETVHTVTWSWASVDADGNQRTDPETGELLWLLSPEVTHKEKKMDPVEYSASGSAELEVWRRPGTFYDGLGDWTQKQGQIITSLQAVSGRWTILWSFHMNRICHWYFQSGLYSLALSEAEKNNFESYYNTIYNRVSHGDPNDEALLLSILERVHQRIRITVKNSGDVITANWFNNCAYCVNNYTWTEAETYAGENGQIEGANPASPGGLLFYSTRWGDNGGAWTMDTTIYTTSGIVGTVYYLTDKPTVKDITPVQAELFDILKRGNVRG